MSLNTILKFKPITTIIALAMAGYHFYVVIFGVPSVFYFRGTHLLFSLVLIFLLHPLKNDGSGKQPKRLLDYVFVLFSILCIGHIFVNHDYVLNRFAYVDDLSPLDVCRVGVLVRGLIVVHSSVVVVVDLLVHRNGRVVHEVLDIIIEQLL